MTLEEIIAQLRAGHTHQVQEATLKDANGDSPLSWASWHLRPGKILDLLCYGPHKVNTAIVEHLTSDHGQGWGNGMENQFL